MSDQPTQAEPIEVPAEQIQDPDDRPGYVDEKSPALLDSGEQEDSA